MNTKIIYITEESFRKNYLNENSLFYYKKKSKIPHPTKKNVYYYNEHQFFDDLKKGLISKEIFSTLNLEEMENKINEYNKKLKPFQPQACGFFKTIKNEFIILRSDLELLKQYNQLNKIQANLIYFTNEYKQIIVLKNTKIYKKIEQDKKILPSNGIRIFKTKIGKNDLLQTSIQKIFGLGSLMTKQLLKQKGISINYKVKNQDLILIKNIENFLKNENIGLTLKKNMWDHLSLLFKSPTYKGTRYRNNLPVRGQRTRTNAKTIRRNRKKEIIITKQTNKRNAKKK